MERCITRKKGLTGAQLKWIALALMVLDHIHYFFEFTGVIPTFFSQLGRLSAGLFLFCMLEGFAHTRNRRLYFARIWAISAGMGLFQYCCIAFGFLRRPDGFVPLNQMLGTFTVLIPMLWGVDLLREKRILPGLAALLLPFAWPYAAIYTLSALAPGAVPAAVFLGYTVLPMHALITDGGTWFVVCGVLMYLCRKHRALEAGVFFAFNLLLYGGTALAVPGVTAHDFFMVYYEWMSAFSAGLMLLYNGERGETRGGKYFFYIFYPAHVYVLYGASCLVYILLA